MRWENRFNGHRLLHLRHHQQNYLPPSLVSMSDCIPGPGKLNASGYTRIRVNGKKTMGHRAAWEKVNGPIPDDLQIDHLCRNRWCVNPEHMELVTREENIRRGIHANQNTNKTVCVNGHELTDENTYSPPHSSRRACKECRLISAREYQRRRRRALSQQETARLHAHSSPRDC